MGFYIQGAELTIQLSLNSGLRAAQFIVNFYIIFEFLFNCIEVLNVVSAGSNLQEPKVSLRLS